MDGPPKNNYGHLFCQPPRGLMAKATADRRPSDPVAKLEADLRTLPEPDADGAGCSPLAGALVGVLAAIGLGLWLVGLFSR
jgi:hypothetical protein